MEKYLEIMDNSSVTSKEQFMLVCAAAGFEIDDAKYFDIVRYEIEQLSMINKLKPMFYDFSEKSLWEYKKHFHLVKSVRTIIDPKTHVSKFEVRMVNPNGDRVFSTSADLMEDMQALFKINMDDEIFNLIKAGGLKR